MSKVIVLGSGAAWPDARRNPPAFAICVDDQSLLFDLGGATTSQLMKAGVNPAQVDYYFLSHLHIDHTLEFPALVLGSYLTGKVNELYLFGPPGTREWCTGLIDQVYYFTRDIAKNVRDVDIDVRIKEIGSGPIIETARWKVTAARVRHGLETFAYRIDTAQGSITYSGDTEPCEELIQLAWKTEILIQDCAFPDHVGEKPGHCVPRQVSEIANRAQVQKVVLFHMFPTCEGFEDEMVASVRSGFSGEVVMAEDLMEICVESRSADESRGSAML